MTRRAVPPVPPICAARPLTEDGLVMPAINVRLADGGVDFRSQHRATFDLCWSGHRCQVCLRPLRHPIVLLCGPAGLASLLFDEPPMHIECARYTAAACPMVGGRQSHYATGPALSERGRGKRCPTPGCECGGWVPHNSRQNEGEPARPWFAVYARTYSLAASPTDPVIGGACTPAEVLRVRQVSDPACGLLHPWRDVPDWAEHYQPPQQVPILAASVAPQAQELPPDDATAPP